jgi:hypothetical protein
MITSATVSAVCSATRRFTSFSIPVRMCWPTCSFDWAMRCGLLLG